MKMLDQCQARRKCWMDDNASTLAAHKALESWGSSVQGQVGRGQYWVLPSPKGKKKWVGLQVRAGGKISKYTPKWMSEAKLTLAKVTRIHTKKDPEYSVPPHTHCSSMNFCLPPSPTAPCHSRVIGVCTERSKLGMTISKQDANLGMVICPSWPGGSSLHIITM